MGIEALIARLEADAESDLEKRRAETAERAARVVEDARRAAEEGRRAWRAARAAELREAAEAELAAARREALARTLSARERLLARVFERARQGFDDALLSDAYRSGLPSTVEGLLRHLGPGEGRIETRPELAESVRAAVAGTGRPGVRVEASDDAEPGLVARDPGETVTVRDTLVSRLERSRPALAIEVWARLRADAGPAAADAGAPEAGGAARAPRAGARTPSSAGGPGGGDDAGLG